MTPSSQLEIPSIVVISTATVSKSVACTDTMRLGACNLTNTGLMRSVKALIPAIMIHHQLGGTEVTGFVACTALMYSNKAKCFSNSYLQTIPMTSQQVDNCGQVACISLINPCCSHRCAINLFIISTTLFSQRSE